MRFHNPERFEKYCIAKRRTYLRQLAGRPNPRRFFDLWRGEFELASNRFQIGGVAESATGEIARSLRWLLLSDLYSFTRRSIPDLPPAPQTVLENLTGGLHQIRRARSMLITGEDGAGKEQLACLLHALSGRPGALVRIPAAELGRNPKASAKQLLPERGSVFLRDIEDMTPEAQDELLAFLNGAARRRDLLFFASTQARSWDLASIHGVRRELLIRFSQTEIRLPGINTRQGDLVRLAEDVAYDTVRLESPRVADLRLEAERLATEWQSDRGIPAPQDYDFVSESLSYVLWREKSSIAGRALEALPTISVPDEGSFRAVARQARIFLDDSKARTGGRPRPLKPILSAEAGSTERRFSTAWTRRELLRAYYRALLDEEAGDVARVAARAGRKITEITRELSDIGLSPRTKSEPESRQEKSPISEISSHQAKPGS
jgi:hypothetical protein